MPQVFTDPIRPHFVNQFIPTLYSDLWGDYFGYFAWLTDQSGYPPIPASTGVKIQLATQNAIGVLPTVLAVAGWIALLRQSLRKAVRRENPGILVVSLLPLVGLLGFLYFTIGYPTEDGDVIKGSYFLITLPGWGIAFGYAWSRLVRYRLPVVLPASILCAAAVVADLIFLLHRGMLGPA